MAGTATKDGLLAWLGQQDTEEAKSLVQLWGQVSGRCPQPTARAVAKELGTNLREGDGGKTDNFKQLSVFLRALPVCKLVIWSEYTKPHKPGGWRLWFLAPCRAGLRRIALSRSRKRVS